MSELLDLRSRAIQTLEADSFFRRRLTVRELEIETAENKLILRGSLPSFYQKQRLQELVLRIEGVHELENLVEVTTND